MESSKGEVSIFQLKNFSFFSPDLILLVATMLVALLLNAALMVMASLQIFIIVEYYPTKMRNIAVGSINAFYRLCVSGSQMFIPIIVTGYGVSGLFLGLAAMLLAAVIIVITLGQRTGGRSLKEIE